MSMYINSLGMRGTHFQTVKDTAGKANGTGQYQYDTVMQKALEKRNAAIGSASEGDMVITQPSVYQNAFDRQAVTVQEKNEMSTKEYRQWFRNEVAAIQSETCFYSPYISDTLVIKEEAFEKMKNDSAWEKEVLGKIRAHCRGQEIAGTKAVGYQIIGVSPESCREEEIPVGPAYPFLTSAGYWNGMLSGQTGLPNYLTQGLLGSQISSGMLSSAAYRNVMNSGMEYSLFGNFML